MNSLSLFLSGYKILYSILLSLFIFFLWNKRAPPLYHIIGPHPSPSIFPSISTTQLFVCQIDAFNKQKKNNKKTIPNLREREIEREKEACGFLFNMNATSIQIQTLTHTHTHNHTNEPKSHNMKMGGGKI